MSEYSPETLQLPEGLQAFLEETGLPVPPVPLALLDSFDAMSDRWFATDAGPEPKPLRFPSDADGFFSSRFAGDRGFAGYGLAGRPFGTQYVIWALAEKTLEFAVSLPWGSAYGDPEAERRELDAAFRIGEVCAAGRPAEGRLAVLIGSDGIEWSLSTPGATLSGDDLDGLLTALENEAAAAEPVSAGAWLAV